MAALAVPPPVGRAPRRVGGLRFGLRAAPRAIGALLLREMASSFGRSAGGALWLVAEPVLGIAILSVLFAMAFQAPALGTSFPIFYASGVLPYLFYMAMGRRVGTAIAFSRPLLAYPAVTVTDAVLARALLVLLTHVAIFALIVGFIEVMFQTQSVHAYDHMAHAFAMAFALGLGVGTLNCFLWALLPDWERLWGVLNKPLFLLSAILFTLESVPEPYRGWLWFNPLVHVTAEMRRGFYPAYRADFVSAGYVYGWAGVTLVAGLFLIAHHQRRRG